MRRRWSALEGVRPEDERVLRRRRIEGSRPLRPDPEGAAAADASAHLVLEAGGVFLALPLRSLRRVERSLRFARALFLPPPVVALAEAGGEVLPVLDAGLVAGAQPLLDRADLFVEVRSAGAGLFLAAAGEPHVRSFAGIEAPEALLPQAVAGIGPGGELVVDLETLAAAVGGAAGAPQSGAER